MIATESCENCGAAVGKLETPFVWNERVVCGPCYGKLKAGGDASKAPPATEHPKQVLAGETVLYRGSLSAARLFTLPVFLLLLGAASWPIGAVFFVPLGVIVGAARALRMATARFSVSDRRIIMSVGLIRRHSFEVLLPKVESVAVEQGVVDRICGSGSVVLIGTGGSREAFPAITNPQKFRQNVLDAVAQFGHAR